MSLRLSAEVEFECEGTYYPGTKGTYWEQGDAPDVLNFKVYSVRKDSRTDVTSILPSEIIEELRQQYMDAEAEELEAS